MGQAKARGAKAFRMSNAIELKRIRDEERLRELEEFEMNLSPELKKKRLESSLLLSTLLGVLS
jgi:hypothetical protein